MTNREKLMEEIGKLTNEQLMDPMMVGYSGICTGGCQDFGLIVCNTCQRRGYCVDNYRTAAGGWMDLPSTTDTIMEVRA